MVKKELKFPASKAEIFPLQFGEISIGAKSIIGMNRYMNPRGFSLVELMIIIAIAGALSAIGVPNYLKYKEKASIVTAISEIRMIERMIVLFETDHGRLPTSLSEIKFSDLDPWGNPYQYLNIKDANEDKNSDETVTRGKSEAGTRDRGGNTGEMRKDHFMVPVNSDYDLYSMGKDGKSVAPFTAKASRDDVVRANTEDFWVWRPSSDDGQGKVKNEGSISIHKKQNRAPDFFYVRLMRIVAHGPAWRDFLFSGLKTAPKPKPGTA